MNTPTFTTPILIMVRGIPGGGKSYVTAKLREAIGRENVVVLDPDAIDHASDEYITHSQTLTSEGVDAKLHPYRFLRSAAYRGIEANKVIIWNQGFIDFDGFSKTVKNLQTYASDHGTTLPTLVVEVEVDAAIAKQRVAKRAATGGHDVPEEAFERFINGYKSFSNVGYTTVTIDGEASIDTSIAAIKHAFSNLPNLTA
jgi:predicted ABC-type ATPase